MRSFKEPYKLQDVVDDPRVQALLDPLLLEGSSLSF
jgi:hypothetical protein